MSHLKAVKGVRIETRYGEDVLRQAQEGGVLLEVKQLDFGSKTAGPYLRTFFLLLSHSLILIFLVLLSIFSMEFSESLKSHLDWRKGSPLRSHTH